MEDNVKDYSNYKKLALTVGIHFFIMYALGYVVVDTLAHAYWFSTRPLYMAMIMVAPMVLLMLFFMRDMYPDKKLNLILYGVSGLIFIGAFFLIRGQIFVGNEMFLKSMIPHHSGAITVCEEADISDPEIIELCENIVRVQEKEITQMKEILERL